MGYGSDTDANALLTSLTSDVEFTIPEVDLSGDKFQIPAGGDLFSAITKLTNADFTEGNVDGKGIFDVMMQGMKAQLKKEFEAGRITGAEYTKSYIALTESAMQNGVQFLLGRDQAYWQAVTAQAGAITARVQLETAKVQYAALQLEALTGKANYALTKAKLATEDVQFGTAEYQLKNLLPQQLNQSIAQTANIAAQTTLATKQLSLVQEQVESARAQTLDTRTDGVTVSGSVGKQKALYDQQITSYKRNAEVSAAKLFTDAWITQKTMDEGLTPPTGFTNAVIDNILSSLRTNNNLG